MKHSIEKNADIKEAYPQKKKKISLNEEARLSCGVKIRGVAHNGLGIEKYRKIHEKI